MRGSKECAFVCVCVCGGGGGVGDPDLPEKSQKYRVT